MKRGVNTSRIALAVGSIITIMSIFAIVLILSGRSVTPIGEAIVYDPTLEESIILEENPCWLIRCIQGKHPILLGYEGVPLYNQYALCVCADLREGRAYYDELQIKKIRTTRPY